MTDVSLLEVHGLAVRTRQRRRAASVTLVSDVDFTVAPGEMVVLVGESGSGKTITGQSVMGLARDAGLEVTGSIRFEGQDLLAASPNEVRRLRGRGLALVPQEPSSALDPLFPVGRQVAEAVRRAERCSSSAARRRAVQLLAEVRISAPERRAGQYPHELSGGLCQRVMIAMALAGHPRLIIADEPTSALDATVQLHLLELLDRLRAEKQTGLLLITHDIGVAARADRMIVLYAGRVVEYGPTARVLERPRHPYTAGLIESVPRPEGPVDAAARLPVIPGTVPSPAHRPVGCPFRNRCPLAADVCASEQPMIVHEGVAGTPAAHAAACCRVTPETSAGSLAALWNPERARSGALDGAAP